MNYFIIAGEASGDLHAANLCKEILQQDQDANVHAWGGPKLTQAGAKVTKSYDELALMGFVEIITKLPQVFKNFNTAVDEILRFQADCVILVDFSGFNLRLAKRLRKAQYKGKIFYYISPKMWVWNGKRVKQVIKYVDAMFCILPFEVDWYKENGYNHAYYIGNPIMDELDAFVPNPKFIDQNNLEGQEIIALLPGSRANEVNQILPKMLEVVSDFEQYQFVIASTPNMYELISEQLRKQNLDLPIVIDQTYDLVVNAQAALVTSGTATLETALLGTPLVLCYRGNGLSFAIAKFVVNIDYIGLPNLIMQKEMVKELIQNTLTKENEQQELTHLLHDRERKAQFANDVNSLREQVGPSGASKRAAVKMLDLLKNQEDY